MESAVVNDLSEERLYEQNYIKRLLEISNKESKIFT
jgi:hypothetical protein